MLGFASAIATTAKAQVSINVSIGSQPRWAPVYYEEVAYQPVVTRYYAPATRYVAARHYAPARRYAPVHHYYKPAKRYYAPRHEVRYIKHDKYHNHGRNGKHGRGRH